MQKQKFMLSGKATESLAQCTQIPSDRKLCFFCLSQCFTKLGFNPHLNMTGKNKGAAKNKGDVFPVEVVRKGKGYVQPSSLMNRSSTTAGVSHKQYTSTQDAEGSFTG